VRGWRYLGPYLRIIFLSRVRLYKVAGSLYFGMPKLPETAETLGKPTHRRTRHGIHRTRDGNTLSVRGPRYGPRPRISSNPAPAYVPQAFIRRQRTSAFTTMTAPTNRCPLLRAARVEPARGKSGLGGRLDNHAAS